MYDKGLILIKCTKGSYKPHNHKNPFTKEYKWAIHRKNAKTLKHMKRLPDLLLNIYWRAKCHFFLIKEVKFLKIIFGWVEWKTYTLILCWWDYILALLFCSSLVLSIRIWTIYIAFINSAVLLPEICLVKICNHSKMHIFCRNKSNKSMKQY